MFAFGSSMKGLPGVLGNKGTLAKCRRQQGNMNPFLGSRGTKLYKLEDENNVSKFMKRRPNTEKVWEHGNIGQFWKGTREQGSPLGDPQHVKNIVSRRKARAAERSRKKATQEKVFFMFNFMLICSVTFFMS